MLKRLLAKSVDLALLPIETTLTFPGWVAVTVLVEVHKLVDLGIPT